MNERRLRERLHAEPIPEERESEERVWEVVHAAYRQRTATPAQPHRRRLVLVLVGATLLLALLLTPAGAQVRDWVEDVIEPDKGRVAPALNRLPAPGHLLVESEQGPWIVDQDGGGRLLGSYDEAAWSPSGMFVGVAEGRQLTAVVGPRGVEPTGKPVGTVRWSLSAQRPVRGVAWAPTGFRVAYLSGGDLRVIVGDGSDDRLLAAGVENVAPAWKPLTPSEQESLVKTGGIGSHVLAYVDGRGRVRLLDTDSRRERRLSPRFDAPVRAIGWSADGAALLVLTEAELTVLANPLDGETAGPTYGFAPWSAVAAVASPRTDEIAAVLQRVRSNGEVSSRLVLLRGERQRVLSTNPGRFTDLAWSPNGRWLVVAWEDADQWLFISPRTGKPDAVGNISSQFDPGGEGSAPFPRIAGWCCPR